MNEAEGRRAGEMDEEPVERGKTRQRKRVKDKEIN